MSSLALLITAALVLQVASQQDSYEPMGNNYPAIYTGDSGTIVCSFTLTTDDYNGLNGFGIRKEVAGIAGSTENTDYCSVSRLPGEAASAVAVGGSLTNDVCDTAIKSIANGETTTLRIPVELTEVAMYRCSAWTANYLDHDVVLNVTKLLVAPTNLRMMFTPNQAYAGDQMTVMCMSDNGDPSSVFEYAIDGEIEKGEIAPFTATREDNGKEFSCKDLSHPNFNGGTSPDTFKEETLTVYYFAATRSDIQNMERNPIESVSMSCDTDMNLPEDVTISYEWKRDDQVVGMNKGLLVANQSEEMNETISVRYDCTATPSDSKLKQVVVSFNITWNVESSTPTVPPTTTASKPTKESDKNTAAVVENSSTTTVIIIVVVVITVIVLVVVVAVIVIKKRNRESADVSKEAGKDPQKTADAEQGNGEPEANEPMLKSSERGEEDADDSGKP